MNSQHNLSDNLKAYRNLRKQTQVQFASEIGISKSALQDIERGKSPNLETLYCISERLQIPVSVLLSDAAPPNQLGVTVQLLQYFDWFVQRTAEEQEALSCAVLQISRSLASLHDNWRNQHEQL